MLSNISRRKFLRIAGLGSAAMALPLMHCTQESSTSQPNVVLIMADDLGAECLECYGSESYSTPNLNQLSAQGMQFNNAYCTPLCTPTRVELMTGQYPFRNGWTGGIWNKPEEQQFLDPDKFNFAHMMRDAGYATAVAGKWQLARFENRPYHPQNTGFDESCLWTWLYSNSPESIRMEGEDKPSRYWGPGIWKNGELMEEIGGKFGPDLYTDHLLDFMERHQSEPFFVYYSMALTHWPFVPVPGKEGDKDGTRTPPRAQEHFSQMVEYMDVLVGRIVSKLDELNLRDNTLLLFTGDNGTAEEIQSQLQGMMIPGGKGDLSEAGTRVPLIANWPGMIPEGVVNNDLIDFTDIVPTMADIAKISNTRAHTDGRSFWPQLQGKSGESRDWIFCQVGDDWFIRSQQYRLRKNGEFADMSDRYHPLILTDELSPTQQQKKDALQSYLTQLMQS